MDCLETTSLKQNTAMLISTKFGLNNGLVLSRGIEMLQKHHSLLPSLSP
jgi:hypothetical protein